MPLTRQAISTFTLRLRGFICVWRLVPDDMMPIEIGLKEFGVITAAIVVSCLGSTGHYLKNPF